MKGEIIDCVFNTDEPDDFSYTVRGFYIAELGILFSEGKISFIKDRLLSTKHFSEKPYIYARPTYPEIDKVKEITIPDSVAEDIKSLCDKIDESARIQKAGRLELVNKLKDIFDTENTTNE